MPAPTTVTPFRIVIFSPTMNELPDMLNCSNAMKSSRNAVDPCVGGTGGENPTMRAMFPLFAPALNVRYCPMCCGMNVSGSLIEMTEIERDGGGVVTGPVTVTVAWSFWNSV